MYLTRHKIVKAANCARELLRDPRLYGGSPDRIPISIEILQDLVAERTGIAIEKYAVSFDATHLVGSVERWDNGRAAKIYIRADADQALQRFVAAKELLQLAVDDEEDLSPYGDEHLERLIEEGHLGFTVVNGPNCDLPPAQSEVIAELTATETLYPWECRAADLESLKAGTTVAQLAPMYQIPEYRIEAALHPTYRRYLERAYAELDESASAAAPAGI